MAGKKMAVDYKKLKKAVEDRNYTIFTAGVEIGRCDTCLYGAKRNGYLSIQVIEDLKDIGITYDMIKPESKEPEKPESETKFTNISEQTLKALLTLQGQQCNNMLEVYRVLIKISEQLDELLA